MAKDRILPNPKQQTSFMSPPHPHTVTIVAEDDDDNDICPVCDGQCTCSKNTPSYYQPAPSSSVSAITPSPARDQPKPVLKIKLPPNVLKRKPIQSHQSTSQQTPGASSSHIPTQSQHVPKRRGRPPKNPALRAATSAAGPSTSAYQRSKAKPTVPRDRPPQKKSIKSTPATTTIRDGGVRKKAIKKRKRVESSSESSASELTDIDHLYSTNNSYNGYTNNRRFVNDDDDDARSVQFPTFVSAISSTSSASSSDIASLSGFETDSSIEAEEENFILAEERARVKRELLHGGAEESLQKRRDTNWVIRPRQMSVGASSDVDMSDSDATEDANDDDDDDDDEEDDDEPDGEYTEDTDARRYGYAGLVTAWSDEEESSFDADIFFANLSDNDSGSSGSSTQSDDGGDGDYSDFDLSETAASLIPHLRQGVGIGIPNLPFEVTEGWDGQVVFTNGLGETPSQGGLHDLLQSDFLPPGPDASPSPGPDNDIDMLSTDADGEADEEGYEQDVDADTAEAEGEGDTTDEELVGDDDLPNERAMSLFNTPFSFSNVSAINPLSTMSPVSSPGGPSVKKPYFSLVADFPKPSDILSRRMSYWDGGNDVEEELVEEVADEAEEEESSSTSERREKEKAARGGLPRTGHFEVSERTRQAVINSERKDIPSSYPRFTNRRGRGQSMKSMSLSMSHGRRVGGNLEDALRNSLRTSSLPPPLTRDTFLSVPAPLSPPVEGPQDTALAPSPSIAVASTDTESASLSEEPCPPPMSIDLDDVLDASFLVVEPAEHADTTPSVGTSAATHAASQSIDGGDLSGRRYIRSLNRWDVISVGAFRKTTEGVLTDSAPGWGSDSSPNYAAYNSVMKSSPLSTMLWHNRNSAARQQRSVEYAMSPELGPVRDGDRTPTNIPRKLNSPPPNTRSRKEQRKERKLKRKSYGPVGHHQQHRLHHQHHHHPNSKTRSTSSSQRTNFFSASVPSLSI